jgi:hypothetical protein
MDAMLLRQYVRDLQGLMVKKNDKSSTSSKGEILFSQPSDGKAAAS